MSKYFAPLGVFIGGQTFLLIGFLFWGALGDAGTQLAVDTADVASTFWGWTWVVGSVRLLVFLIVEGIILFSTAKAFLAVRDN